MIDEQTQRILSEKYNPEGSDLREVQHRLLDMLLYLADVCDRIGVQYYLDGGTLLGAFRHGGFIPWDDDLDIVIDVTDVKRLKKYLLDHPHPLYYLQDRRTDKGYYNGWMKLRDRYSSSIYEGCYLEVQNHQNSILYSGVFVDIFQYSDHVIPSLNKVLHGFHKRVNMRYLLGNNRTKWIAYFLSGLLFYVLKPIANIFGKLLCNKKTIAHDYCSCNTVHRFEKDKVYPLSTIEFEGYVFKAPNDVDYYLKTLYDDYMSLPPEDTRHHHDLVFKLSDYPESVN